MEKNINIIECQVIDVDDSQNGDRIKVKLLPDDQGLSKDKIPYAYPLLPKMFHVKPKVGEWVKVLLAASNDRYAKRYYIGPIISQPQNMQKDTYASGALSLYPDGGILPKVSSERLEEVKGAFCEEEDIAIYGRKGCDIILKENDIRIRCGARIDGDNQIGKYFNKISPAYLKMKYYEDGVSVVDKRGNENKYNSVATLVADQINLISNDSRTPWFDTTDNEDLVTDKTIEEIIKNAHQLPYGDTLVDFLKYFLKMFEVHSHAYPGLPTILPAGEKEKLFSYDLEQILSKNIRIN